MIVFIDCISDFNSSADKKVFKDLENSMVLYGEDSIVVSIRGCGPRDPGSTPGLRPLLQEVVK